MFIALLEGNLNLSYICKLVHEMIIINAMKRYKLSYMLHSALLTGDKTEGPKGRGVQQSGYHIVSCIVFRQNK